MRHVTTNHLILHVLISHSSFYAPVRGQGHGKCGYGSYLLPISEGVQVCRTVCVNGYCGAYLVISWTSAHLHCGIEPVVLDHRGYVFHCAG